MNLLIRGLFLVAFTLAVASFTSIAEDSSAAPTLTTKEAIDHIGHTSTVCGVVAGTRFLESTERKLTLLNLDAPFPNQPFDVVIEFADRAKFAEPPDVFFKGKKICVTGLIEIFKGKAQMYVTHPDQIRVVESP